MKIALKTGMLAGLIAAGLTAGCSKPVAHQTSYQGESTKAADVIAQRNLKPDDVVRNGHHVTVNMTIVRSHFTPEIVEVNQGDDITWHVTNFERTPNATHGLSISAYNVNLTLNPGEASTIHFVADRAGVVVS